LRILDEEGKKIICHRSFSIYQFPFEEIWGFKFEVDPLLVMSEPHATASWYGFHQMETDK